MYCTFQIEDNVDQISVNSMIMFNKLSKIYKEEQQDDQENENSLHKVEFQIDLDLVFNETITNINNNLIYETINEELYITPLSLFTVNKIEFGNSKVLTKITLSPLKIQPVKHFLYESIYLINNYMGTESNDLIMYLDYYDKVYRYANDSNNIKSNLSKTSSLDSSSECNFSKFSEFKMYLYNIKGKLHHLMNKLYTALEIYNENLNILESKVKTYKVKIFMAISLFNKGYIKYKHSQYSESIELFNKVITIYNELFGEESIIVASSHNRIGENYYVIDKYSKASPYLRKALELRLRFNGKYHIDTATSYNNVGIIIELYDRDKKLGEDYELICFELKKEILLFVTVYWKFF